MDHRLIISILFVLSIGIPEKVNGLRNYKWVPLSSGDMLPSNTVLIKGSQEKYVGRARHFDEILPAEVTADGSATISTCHKNIPKQKFEILTTLAVDCQWRSYSNIQNIDETVVRAGTAWNGEPIFVGSASDDSYDYIYSISSIYLTSDKTYTRNTNYYYRSPEWYYLSCNLTNEWIDSSSGNLPNNTLSGGKSEDEYEIYVARLKRECDVVTGQVIPEIGIATAFLNDGVAFQAPYCQVLLGEPDEYTWVSASDGEIPDYAVVNGKYGNELSYVARFNKTIGHLTHFKALDQQLDYDILVMH